MWAFPTATAKKAHWFSGQGAISPCRRYINSIPGLMAPAFDSESRCKVCSEKKEAN